MAEPGLTAAPDPVLLTERPIPTLNLLSKHVEARAGAVPAYEKRTKTAQVLIRRLGRLLALLDDSGALTALGADVACLLRAGDVDLAWLHVAERARAIAPDLIDADTADLREAVERWAAAAGVPVPPKAMMAITDYRRALAGNPPPIGYGPSDSDRIKGALARQRSQQSGAEPSSPAPEPPPAPVAPRRSPGTPVSRPRAVPPVAAIGSGGELRRIQYLFDAYKTELEALQARMRPADRARRFELIAELRDLDSRLSALSRLDVEQSL